MTFLSMQTSCIRTHRRWLHKNQRCFPSTSHHLRELAHVLRTCGPSTNTSCVRFSSTSTVGPMSNELMPSMRNSNEMLMTSRTSTNRMRRLALIPHVHEAEATIATTTLPNRRTVTWQITSRTEESNNRTRRARRKQM